MVGPGMFDGLLSGLLSGLLMIFVAGVLTFGVAGFFIGKRVAYKKAINDVAYERVHISKKAVSDTTIMAENTATIKIKQRLSGLYYFVLCAPNGQVLVRSEDYTTLSAATNGAHALIRFSANAEIKDETENNTH